MKPTYFPTPKAWREWLEANHGKQSELLVGFYKKDSGRPSITWPESVDGALSFGWIDGVRRRIDDVSYSIRFSPRRPRSIWSNINIRRVAELTKLGLMHKAGLAAFEGRDESRSGIYLYEQQKTLSFDSAIEERFRSNRGAYQFFAAQPPGYRKIAAKWVMTAKREETRKARLAVLIDESASKKRIGLHTRMNPPPKEPRTKSLTRGTRHEGQEVRRLLEEPRTE